MTTQEVGEPLFERPLLELFLLHTSDILETAADRHEGSVDVSALEAAHTEHVSNSCIARVAERVCHGDGGADDADLHDDKDWLTIGPEKPAEKRTIHSKRLDEAHAHTIPPDCMKSLDDLLLKFEDVVKLKQIAGAPSDIEPLHNPLKQDAISVRSKQRKHPQKKRVFMTGNVNRLSRLGFVKPAISPEWFLAPIIVLKCPPAMFQFAIDYCSVNCTTIPTIWLLSNAESKLADTREATFFSLISAAVFGKRPCPPTVSHFTPS